MTEQKEKDLREFLETHPHVKQVYIGVNGEFYINAYEGPDGKWYAVLPDPSSAGGNAGTVAIDKTIDAGKYKETDNSVTAKAEGVEPDGVKYIGPKDAPLDTEAKNVEEYKEAQVANVETQHDTYHAPGVDTEFADRAGEPEEGAKSDTGGEGEGSEEKKD